MVAIENVAQDGQDDRQCGAVREAGLGNVDWRSATGALAATFRVRSARIIRLRATTGPDRSDASPPLRPLRMAASSDVLNLWQTICGAQHPVTDDRDQRAPVVFDPDAEDGRSAVDGFAFHAPDGFWGVLFDPPVKLGRDGRLSRCRNAVSLAARTEQRIEAARIETALALLDTAGAAAMTLDRDGWVHERNACARRLFDVMLHAAPTRAHSETLIANGMPAQALAQSSAADTVRQYLFETPDKQRLIIYAVAMPPDADRPFAPLRLLLIAWRMDDERQAPSTSSAAPSNATLADDLRHTLGLTPAEARLAAQLNAGDLHEAAARAGMGYETARSHLKSLFVKTGIRQRDRLSAMIARFAWHRDIGRTLSRR